MQPIMSRRRRSRDSTALTFLFGVTLAACEHPLPPPNPTPLEAAAQQLDVPMSVLVELRQTADRLEKSLPPSSTPPAPSAAQVKRLQRVTAQLQQRYTDSARAAP
jgi:hypothetical protein